MPAKRTSKPQPSIVNESQAEPAPRVKRTGKALNVWIDSDLRDQFAASAKRNKRQLNAELEIAIEEYLAKRGITPTRAGDAIDD